MQRTDSDLAEVYEIKYSDYSQQPQIHAADSRDLAGFVPCFRKQTANYFTQEQQEHRCVSYFSFYCPYFVSLSLLESNIFSHSSEGGREAERNRNRMWLPQQ